MQLFARSRKGLGRFIQDILTANRVLRAAAAALSGSKQATKTRNDPNVYT